MIEVRYELSISHIMLNSFSIMLLPSLILGLNQTIHLFFKIKILENTRQKMLRKTPGTLLICVTLKGQICTSVHANLLHREIMYHNYEMAYKSKK